MYTIIEINYGFGSKNHIWRLTNLTKTLIGWQYPNGHNESKIVP